MYEAAGMLVSGKSWAQLITYLRELQRSLMSVICCEIAALRIPGQRFTYCLTDLFALHVGKGVDKEIHS